MISLALTTTLSPTQQHSSLSLRPPITFRPSLYNTPALDRRLGGRTLCRAAELSSDAPFAAAIGACVLSSLFFPAPGAEEDGDGGRADSVLDSDDSRLIVMSVISFIPYFNWLSWVFAWLDTGKRRYAVYALVYLIPYIRSNLSLSTDESWLPIASIILCVIHVQLETSIKNGDIQGFQLFSEASKRVSSTSSRKDSTNISRHSSEGRENEKGSHLPSADEHSGNEIRGSGVPKDSHDGKRLDADWEGDSKKKH